MIGSLFRVEVTRNAYILGLVALYCVTHFLLLTRLPMFSDEAVNINRASDTFESFHNFKNYGLWDGRWLTVKTLGLFLQLPLSPLVSIRAAAVVSGVGTLVAIILGGKILFSRNEGVIAGSLFLVVPYAFFVNRVAVSDNFAVAFGAWALVLSIAVATSTSVVLPLLLAVALIGAILSKLSGAFLLFIPITAVLFLTARQEWRNALARVAPAYAGSLLVLAVLFWKESGTKHAGDRLGILDPADVGHNLGLVFDWSWSLLTPPLLITTLLALLAVWFVRERRYAFLAVVTIVAVAPYVLITWGLWPHYLLYAVVPTALLLARLATIVAPRARAWLSGWSDSHAAGSVLVAGVAVGLMVWPVFLSLSIMLRPERADLPERLRFQWVTGRPAGYGLTELVDFLNAQANSDHAGITVLRFPYWGPLRDGLDVYLSPSESLRIYYLDPSSPEPYPAAVVDTAERRTLLVINPPIENTELRKLGKLLHPYLEGAELVWSYIKPGGEIELQVWELIKPGSAL